MREVKCLSSAVASVRPSRTGSQCCLEKPRKTKGLKLGLWVLGFRVGRPSEMELESCQAWRADYREDTASETQRIEVEEKVLCVWDCCVYLGLWTHLKLKVRKRGLLDARRFLLTLSLSLLSTPPLNSSLQGFPGVWTTAGQQGYEQTPGEGGEVPRQRPAGKN